MKNIIIHTDNIEWLHNISSYYKKLDCAIIFISYTNIQVDISLFDEVYQPEFKYKLNEIKNIIEEINNRIKIHKIIINNDLIFNLIHKWNLSKKIVINVNIKDKISIFNKILFSNILKHKKKCKFIGDKNTFQFLGKHNIKITNIEKKYKSHKIGVLSYINNKIIFENILNNFKNQEFKNKYLYLIFGVNFEIKELTAVSKNFKNIIEDIDIKIFYEKELVNCQVILEDMIKDNIEYCSIFSNNHYSEEYLTEQLDYLIDEDLEVSYCKNTIYSISDNKFYDLDIGKDFFLFTSLFLKISDKFFTLDVKLSNIMDITDNISNQNFNKNRKSINIINNLDKIDKCLKEIMAIKDEKVIIDNYFKLNSFKLVDIDKLLVSVIVTMYNSKNTIFKCISSLIEQSHKNIEIIIVDDNSEDESVQIVNKFIDKYTNIKLIQNKSNKGTYFCKNKALSKLNSKTDYITFQDSDDYSDIERIRKQVEILHLNKGYMSTCLCKRNNHIRIAPITMTISYNVFNKVIGYFDNNRFGADSEYIHRFMRYFNILLKGNFMFDYFNSLSCSINNVYYCLPSLLYNINRNDNNCLTIKHKGKEREIYKKKFLKKIENLSTLYYNFDE